MFVMKYMVKGMVKGILPFYLFTFLPSPAVAQKLESIRTAVDAGITGYQQPITAVFEFRNKSSRKLHISKVVPDCNCTVVDYPTNPIGGNEKFQIRMTYNARQLGHFDKQAAIISNGTEQPVYIRMKGVVLAEVQEFTGSYEVEMGELRLDKSELEFDDINRGDVQEQVIHLYNSGSRVLQPNLMHMPSYLTAVASPENLNPGRAGKITVTLNSDKLRDYGLTQTSIYLAAMPGEKVSRDKEIPVSAILLPSFGDLSKQSLYKSPRLQLSKESLDILFEGKSKKTEVIDVANVGQSELNITSLQLFTSGLKISLGKRKLQPGESTKLKITAYRDALQKVRTRPRILMIVNDSQKPKVTITINTNF